MKTFFSRPICLAGLVILTLLKTSLAQAQTTTDLGAHEPLTAAPIGSQLEWHNALPVSAANEITGTQITAAPVGLYYAVYHFLSENCYSDPTPLRVVAPACPATTVDLNSYVNQNPDAIPLGNIVTFHSNAPPPSSSNRITAADAAAAPAGTYYVAFYDQVADCYSAYSTIIVLDNPTCCPSAPIVGIFAQPSCTGNDGSIGLSGLPASGTWTITVNPSISGASGLTGSGTSTAVGNLPDGIYTFTVTSNGCTSPASQSVTLARSSGCIVCPVTPALNVLTQPTCTVGTGSFSITNFDASATYTVSPSAGVNISGNTITAPVGTYTVTATANLCTPVTSAPVVLDAPSNCPSLCTSPLLTTQSAECNGTTYNVSFNSNGAVTASAGTVNGNVITNIPVGTNVIITSTSTCGNLTTTATITSPTSCINPPIGCTIPVLSAGQGVCTGTGTYSVGFNASAGAIVTASAGTVSGNTIINIPIAGNVTITATNGLCSTSITVNHPTDCSTACATPGASFSAGICNGTTYSVNIDNPNNATITTNAGTLTATAITGIPVGTDVSITTAVTGCNAQTITITSPSKAAPVLTTGSAVCSGATYSVAFNSNGIVTVSAGTVSGNSIINIPVGTNVVLTATSINGCATTLATVTSPTSCTNPPVGCVTPTLSAGQGVCEGTGSYSVSFSASAGATITASAGTISGNTIINIPIGSNVIITAANGACNTSITINHPADCSTPCATSGASFSAGVCNGTTYSINIANPNNATITASAGTVTATAITGIPVGTNVVITATASGCSAQTVTINSPSGAAPILTAQSAICNGTTYSVAFAASNGATVTASAGFIFGNVVFNIPIGANVTLTAAFGTCSTAVAISHPADCNTPCASTPASFSGSICNGNTYSVFISNPNGATITASAGTVSTAAITGIPIGTNVIITATASGCMPQTVVITSPAICTQPDFSPTIDISAVNVTSAGRDFVVNINNLSNNTNVGQLVFRIRKADGFNITYNLTATTANVFGGEPVMNSDWSFADSDSFITMTLKAGKLIGGLAASSVGFTITPIAGTPKNTSVSITATISSGSGGDSNSANNLTTTSVITR